MELKKVGAWSILITIIGGLATEARHQIYKNEVEIARVQEREKSNKEILLEVKKEVTIIREHLLQRRQ